MLSCNMSDNCVTFKFLKLWVLCKEYKFPKLPKFYD